MGPADRPAVAACRGYEVDLDIRTHLLDADLAGLRGEGGHGPHVGRPRAQLALRGRPQGHLSLNDGLLLGPGRHRDRQGEQQQHRGAPEARTSLHGQAQGVAHWRGVYGAPWTPALTGPAGPEIIESERRSHP